MLSQTLELELFCYYIDWNYLVNICIMLVLNWFDHTYPCLAVWEKEASKKQIDNNLPKRTTKSLEYFPEN